jgi:hypothetical protein
MKHDKRSRRGNMKKNGRGATVKKAEMPIGVGIM